MKKLNLLLVNLLFFGLFFTCFSQELALTNTNEMKLNYNELEYIDGLYYHDDNLFTGSFYSFYSTNGGR